MKEEAEFPYLGYRLYTTYHKKEGRTYVILVKIGDDKDRKILSYARYLMSVKEKRILESYEEVDHINEIKSDDRIENLQILTGKQNREKYIKTHDIKRKTEMLICPNCKIEFEREIGQISSKYEAKLDFCSRRCSGIYYSKINGMPFKKDENHGVNMYRYGCRCEICKKGNTEKHRKYREKKKRKSEGVSA